jgi:hypothetical protein
LPATLRKRVKVATIEPDPGAADGQFDGGVAERKATLEIEKLSLEVASLRASLKADWTKTYWPVVCAIVLGVASLVTYFASASWQQWLDRRAQIENGLLWATDMDSAARRTAGAGALSAKWGQGYDEAIASTLIALLVDPNPLVRRGSIDAIEFAVYGNSTVQACAADEIDRATAQRIRLLYGDRFLDWRGVITRHLAALEDLSTSEYLVENAPTRDEAVRAAKDGIRKNWECLRAANFRGLDLSGIDLFQANLQDADLRETNLNWADLWEANLSGALLTRSETSGEFAVRSVEHANVAGIQGADAFRVWAIEHGAVEMGRDEYQLWRMRWQTEPAGVPRFDWARLAHDGFRIDAAGTPVTVDGVPLAGSD